MNKTIFLTGIAFGTLAIILGAFGAHALQERLSIDAQNSFETAVRYQMYHALFLLILARLDTVPGISVKPVFILTLLGVFAFSFSIYLLSTSELTGLEMNYLGLMTPFGGILLISGWILLGYRVYKYLN
ncbi:MAG: DUF423 domain-containing protein [Flavobacteriaceae bacterium]